MATCTEPGTVHRRVKLYVHERRHGARDGRRRLIPVVDPASHQVEEDVPKIGPAMVRLSTVSPRAAHHVREEPFVDVEILKVDGRKS